MNTRKPEELSVAMVYEDEESQSRGAQMCARVQGLLGRECMKVSAWRIRDLGHAAVLPMASQAANAADVVLVSLASNGPLPVLLCVWIDTWLPRRMPSTGALVAILPGKIDNGPHGPEEYLQAVARRGKLDFFAEAGTAKLRRSDDCVAPREYDQGAMARRGRCD